MGCLDGKHIKIDAPPQSGSYYYNYKGFFSIVLMALADANSNFIYIDVGSNGRISDGGVWKDCSLAKSIINNDINFPQPQALPGSDTISPFVILADEAFPLQPYLMKPYPSRNLTDERRTFNYRLSRARHIVENAFGLLVQRFRVLRSSLYLSPEKSEKVVKATCVLHNFFNIYGSGIPNDIDTSTLIGLQSMGINASTGTAQEIRNNFASFFQVNRIYFY